MFLVAPRILAISDKKSKSYSRKNETAITWITRNDLVGSHPDKLFLDYFGIDSVNLFGHRISL